jgi:hypothetical protein
MKWIFLILAVCGMFFVQSHVAPHFWTHTYLVPYTKLAVTYGLSAVMVVVGLGIGWLKFGKA